MQCSGFQYQVVGLKSCYQDCIHSWKELHLVGHQNHSFALQCVHYTSLQKKKSNIKNQKIRNGFICLQKFQHEHTHTISQALTK